VLIFYFFFHGAPREVKGRPAAAKVGAAGQYGMLYAAFSKFLPKLISLFVLPRLMKVPVTLMQ